MSVDVFRIPAAVIRDPQPSVFLPTLPTARPTTPTTTTVTTSRPQPLPVRPDSIPTRASVAPPPRANFVEKSPQQSATRPLTPVSIFRQAGVLYFMLILVHPSIYLKHLHMNKVYYKLEVYCTKRLKVGKITLAI